MDNIDAEKRRIMNEWGTDEPTAHMIARSLAGLSVGDVIVVDPETGEERPHEYHTIPIEDDTK